jgi:hypothetical protein
VLGEVQVGAAGVFAVAGPLRFTVPEKDQPMIADTHVH